MSLSLHCISTVTIVQASSYLYCIQHLLVSVQSGLNDQGTFLGFTRLAEDAQLPISRGLTLLLISSLTKLW